MMGRPWPVIRDRARSAQAPQHRGAAIQMNSCLHQAVLATIGEEVARHQRMHSGRSVTDIKALHNSTPAAPLAK
eukprot:3959314-Pyramimonas_sp.AAC.1